LREKFLKRDGRVGRPPDDEERERAADEGSSSEGAAATAANSDEEVGERGELSLPHGECGGEAMPAFIMGTCESEFESASAREGATGDVTDGVEDG
jgi:hypothetical protein